MRHLLWSAVLGLCATGLPGLAWAYGSELSGGPATPVRSPAVSPVKLVDAPAPTCGKHGTSIDFVDTPSEAARQAKKEGKLVFVLHLSGIFEDPRFT
jgi:hypothetical protein